MWLEILLVFLSLFLALYHYVSKNFDKWKGSGISYVKGSFPFGSYNFFGGRHIHEMNEEDHMKFASEKYFGYFLFGKPVLAITDVNLLKQIMVKDFDHFVDRESAEFGKTRFAGGDLDKVGIEKVQK